jgi:hypothetical protein
MNPFGAALPAVLDGFLLADQRLKPSMKEILSIGRVNGTKLAMPPCTLGMVLLVGLLCLTTEAAGVMHSHMWMTKLGKTTQDYPFHRLARHQVACGIVGMVDYCDWIRQPKAIGISIAGGLDSLDSFAIYSNNTPPRHKSNLTLRP